METNMTEMNATKAPRRILAPIDFSEASRKALEYAVQIATQADGEVQMLYVVEPPVFPEWGYAHLVIRDEKLRHTAVEKLEEWRRIVDPAARRITSNRVLTGDPDVKIVEAAREYAADLVVMASHGLGLKHALLGSTVERVVRHAPCAVLTFRERVLSAEDGAGRGLHPQRILVATDFSDNSRSAIHQAIALATQNAGARVHLIYVMPTALPADLRHVGMALEEKSREAEARKILDAFAQSEVPEPVRGEALLRSGGAYHEIHRAAEEMQADLIVLSTHGHSGMKHLLLGSTAERVVRYAPCPVLVTRSTLGAKTV
jgi:nucleotide-binding universal stress UspA family protein